MQKLMGDKGVCVGGSMFFSIDPKDLSLSLRTGLQCTLSLELSMVPYPEMYPKLNIIVQKIL